MSETFLIPNDYACEACGSKDGQWIHAANGDGVAIMCQTCDAVTDRHLSWRDGVRGLKGKANENE